MKPFNPNKEELEDGELRRGPWTLEEDNILIHHIALHGEGRWNLLAKTAGLKRTGKSCRLRWLNYLKPDIKRGNLTPQEQLVILELHSKWGNRWSKIAQHLPGRTDNEIKNYWRTRVQKQAKHLNMETNSQSFFDAIRCFYIPRLVQKIEQNSFTSTSISYPAFSASPSTIEAAMRSSFPPAEAGVDNVDQSYMDYSSSSASQTSFYSSECSKALNPVEVSGHPSNPFDAYTSGDVPQSMESSAVSSDNWYYMDTSNYDMKELPCISAMGQWPDAYAADHNWISNDVADATWNMDGLW